MRSFTTVLLPCILLSGCEVLDTSRLNLFSQTKSASEVITPEVDPTPKLSRIIETFTGKVSWYSVKNNGGTRTASGERLSDSENTAAHRSLPFGTLVEVTNLANGKSVVVRIIDRGPFSHNRVLDVSICAARKLDFVGKGITNCRIDVLRKQ